MRLRRYLEGLDDLTLPRLRRILRSHYQEKSPTELYRQLSTLVQEPQESPQSLLIRALDTRQKILFASQELDTQLKYDPKLVQGMFLHHWSSHKGLCQAIQQLEAQRTPEVVNGDGHVLTVI